MSSCSVGPDFNLPKAGLPKSYIARMNTSETVPASELVASVNLAQWWRSFRDPQLVSLVERSIAANPEIAITLARLQQARAQQFVAIGAALPNGELSAGAAVGTGTDNTRARISDTLHSAANTTGFNHINEAGGFDAAWELDIFGKLRREIEASHLDALAAAKARDAVLVSVIADVARAYIELRGFQAQIAVTRSNIESARRRLQFVQDRFNQGLTNELDVTLAQRQLATFEAGLGPLAGQVQSSRYVIAALLGQYPETLVLRADGPAPRFPTKVPIGLPVSLLQRRADIQQAEFEVGAATARMGSAIADLFPRVAVTTAIGGQGGPLAATGTSITFIGGIGPALYWPVLDFGTLDARIEVADYRAREALLRYKANVLGAVQQVDQAIAGYNAEQSRLNSLSRARSAALDAVRLSTDRYERGLTDFLNVLDAERQRFEIEAQYEISRRIAGVQLVALYKALGGGWEHYQAVPPIRLPEPAIIAAARESNTLRPMSTDPDLSRVQP
ncbi:efflux transporter outer membrane subunit [Bradyrhizobium erythrophlei]|uniref:efflux transporter outer membrane subunit n=1 Tax=Bradyrhizobium erythrophlei TaxID=1437360 RepID=UPI00155F5DDF|nr:efflux transporter outer membrane subunit [Bradyrhizobium erythrophlei]